LQKIVATCSSNDASGLKHSKKLFFTRKRKLFILKNLTFKARVELVHFKYGLEWIHRKPYWFLKFLKNMTWPFLNCKFSALFWINHIKYLSDKKFSVINYGSSTCTDQKLWESFEIVKSRIETSWKVKSSFVCRSYFL